ncbi:MAG: hypothetical protein AAGG46_05345 [Planctomycetota bacterium]
MARSFTNTVAVAGTVTRSVPLPLATTGFAVTWGVDWATITLRGATAWLEYEPWLPCVMTVVCTAELELELELLLPCDALDELLLPCEAWSLLKKRRTGPTWLLLLLDELPWLEYDA